METILRAGGKLRRLSTPCDLLVAYRGRMCTIEVKDGAQPPSQREQTRIELAWAAECAAVGAPHYVVTSVEGALEALADLARRRLTT